MTNLNERFNDLADAVSEAMGFWWVSAVWFVAIAVWTIYCGTSQGAGWWYGQFFNFPLNLVTTVAELFIGLFLAAAANRAERRNRALHAHLAEIHEHLEQLVAREEGEIEQIEHDLGNRKRERRADQIES